MAEFLLSKSNTTLRQQERIFGLTRLVLCSFKENEYTFSHLLFVLVYLKIIKEELFLKIYRNEFSLPELSQVIGDLLFIEKFDGNRLNLAYVEALLLWFYNNNNDYRNRFNLYTKDDKGIPITTIKSKLTQDNDSLANYFLNLERQRYYDLNLDYLLNRINLTEPITIQ